MILTWRTDAKASRDSRFSLILRELSISPTKAMPQNSSFIQTDEANACHPCERWGSGRGDMTKRRTGRAVVGGKAGNRIARVREHDTCLRSAPGVRLGRAQLFALPRGASGHGASLPAARGAADGFRRRSSCSRTTAPAAKSLARRAERTATRQSSRRTSRSRIETPAA